MTARIAIALAQINPTVGDIDGNVGLIRDARRRAAEAGRGRRAPARAVRRRLPARGPGAEAGAAPTTPCAAVEILAAETADGGPALIVGSPWRDEGRPALQRRLAAPGRPRRRPALTKHELPNYGVFDEKRGVRPRPRAGPARLPAAGRRVRPARRHGLRGHVDRGRGRGAGRERRRDPAGAATARPARRASRTAASSSRWRASTETGLPLIYVNQVGGQDELVFDGASFALDADRRLVAQLPAFVEARRADALASGGGDEAWRAGRRRPDPGAARASSRAIYRAMVLGLRDYVDKNRFPGVVLGLSGGIDSALSAAVAVDALGPDAGARGHDAVALHLAATSLEDAADCARRARHPPRRDPDRAGRRAPSADMLAPVFADRPPDITEENIQAAHPRRAS